MLLADSLLMEATNVARMCEFAVDKDRTFIQASVLHKLHNTVDLSYAKA